MDEEQKARLSRMRRELSRAAQRARRTIIIVGDHVGVVSHVYDVRRDERTIFVTRAGDRARATAYIVHDVVRRVDYDKTAAEAMYELLRHLTMIFDVWIRGHVVISERAELRTVLVHVVMVESERGTAIRAEREDGRFAYVLHVI